MCHQTEGMNIRLVGAAQDVKTNLWCHMLRFFPIQLSSGIQGLFVLNIESITHAHRKVFVVEKSRGM